MNAAKESSIEIVDISIQLYETLNMNAELEM